jgi:hypothetical protein
MIFTMRCETGRIFTEFLCQIGRMSSDVRDRRAFVNEPRVMVEPAR